ncbi:MAG: hypothetical protein QOI92_1833 [Chloroflexota bacterium]|nr:hypothetical protein [Chloroflexota bacterium]
MSDGSLSIEPNEATASVGAPAAAEAAAAKASAAQTATLSLNAPEPVSAVAPQQAEAAVQIDAGEAAKLDARVDSYVEGVTTLDIHDAAFATRVRDIQKLGDTDIKASAELSNRLLQKPLAAAARTGVSDASDISKSLLTLRQTIEDLDPSTQGDLLSPKRLFGILPFGDRIRDYFGKYQSSQSHLNAIIESLYHGQGELQKDNGDLEQEKVNLWAVMGRLRQYIYLGQRLDTALTDKIAGIQATDPDRTKALNEDLLFPVRQKVQDLLTQLAVSVQGYLALDLIRRNNVELIKGVDRATTTTVSALRTAIIVAQALSDQKLVLDQITALNATTGHLIESTAEMLRQQSGAISEQAAASTVELATLQAAFTNIYATMDEVDAFKVKAMDSMSKTIDALSTEISRSHAYLDRAHATDQAPSDVPSNPDA